ncbi:unnamed protein product [Protopolystoma xenopodis]|uniref:Uncharacterized protein n=1 Tax=Protopolystoma xenopodis TaxID=117903 RepID=A0A3S5APL5_9PLAT|nr:unnamed protein product [Protopolystoma xenopodis]
MYSTNWKLSPPPSSPPTLTTALNQDVVKSLKRQRDHHHHHHHHHRDSKEPGGKEKKRKKDKRRDRKERRRRDRGKERDVEQGAESEQVDEQGVTVEFEDKEADLTREASQEDSDGSVKPEPTPEPGLPDKQTNPDSSTEIFEPNAGNTEAPRPETASGPDKRERRRAKRTRWSDANNEEEDEDFGSLAGVNGDRKLRSLFPDNQGKEEEEIAVEEARILHELERRSRLIKVILPDLEQLKPDQCKRLTREESALLILKEAIEFDSVSASQHINLLHLASLIHTLR